MAERLGRYSVTQRRIHADEKWCALSWDARAIWHNAYTLPGITQIGCLHESKLGLREKIRCPEERFGEPFKELLERGLLEMDERAHLIAFPKYIVYNPPANGNVIIGWSDTLVELPECDLLRRQLARVYRYLKTRKESFLESFQVCLGNCYPNGLGNRTPNQEQEAGTGSVDQPPPPDQGSHSVDGGGGGNGFKDPDWVGLEALMEELVDSMSLEGPDRG